LNYSIMQLISDKGPSRSLNRNFRYVFSIIALLLIASLSFSKRKTISSNIKSLRQCHPGYSDAISAVVAAEQPQLVAPAAGYVASALITSKKSAQKAGKGYVAPEPLSNISLPILSTEKSLSDGTLRYDRKSSTTIDPLLLILCMSYNEDSWARTPDFSRARTEDDFLDLIAGQVDLSQTSLAFLTASKKVYERLIAATARRDIARVTIVFRKSTMSFLPAHRHDDNIQYERRASLAVIRNILMSRALQDEKHLFWIDADVIDMTQNMITTMVGRAEANKEEVGLITARSDLIGAPNYDRNSWGIDRNVGEILLAVSEDKRDGVNRRLLDTRRYIPEQTRGLIGDQLGRLDSVGGTSLYIRADLVRNGVNFPAFKIVGTTWKEDGWVGQETEGICYMAKRVAGVNCWSLGENHFTTHAS
jgi:hypothetical protein